MKKLISNPFVKIPVMLIGVVVLENLLFKSYTYLDKNDFKLFERVHKATPEQHPEHSLPLLGEYFFC